MSARADGLESWASLWQPRTSTPRWVIWNADGETMPFDLELNVPAPVEDEFLPEVLHRMRRAGVPEGDDYPGRPCA
ncbi:hypothetical protein OG413_31950 [Streptomyces sp. NBC_01433]|uniref:hypothetical protein n=1 Tax=Streptomyces sp. NBC_01433 TaxID=2903864 RepID=UPI00225B551D|nr:hypothetical protein [Streptomyces sp. NBC_01433]MCX4679841.1 hypothetical protein [Streptomyces sp. NBC_01433]